jgi:hypothetical protein
MYPFFALEPALLLFPFRYFDAVRGKWVRARYVAERHEIEARYEQWEISGPPEVRSRGYAMMFSPSAAMAVVVCAPTRGVIFEANKVRQFIQC